jgi:hypothetical protein
MAIKPKAFELLAFLVRNPGQVFTRDQLLEKVWGYDYAGETRTVDVLVHWLRSAIEVDPSHPRYLQTVRGVGYVLRLPPERRASGLSDGSEFLCIIRWTISPVLGRVAFPPTDRPRAMMTSSVWRDGIVMAAVTAHRPA